MQENTLIIPNAFSPNNDGTNDVFHINGANIAEFTMAIFDRWGQKVYETKATNLNEGWNGLYPDGKTAELGVYVYQLTVSFSDGKTEFAKGNISLLW
jgi:gliding motility-associated-like protein